MDNGVNISNREIYDAVQALSTKLDEHLTEHRVLVEVKNEKTLHWRFRVTTWVAIIAAFGTSLAGLVGHL